MVLMRVTPAAAALVVLAILAMSGSPAGAASFYLTTDVPTDLGAAGTTFLPWQLIRNDSGIYWSALLLPADTVFDALHRMDTGDWLVSVERPVILGGTPLEPIDVARYDGAACTMYFDGSAHGVPDSSNLDAVFLDGGDAGDLVVSFDVPTTIGPSTYEPADLVRFDGASFNLYFDASAAVPPIPPSANLTGADERGSLTILTFDAPTTLGSQTFQPGQLVSWDGRSFTTFYLDPGWPAGSAIDALAFLPHPGSVPPTIDVTHSPVRGKLRISWSQSCSAGAEDYAIYEGVIGDWYSHVALDCSDDGADLREDITPSSGNRYYLVVPLNANDEGSYGTASDGTSRPPGGSACVASQALAACP
jgi:hypothetical protein